MKVKHTFYISTLLILLSVLCAPTAHAMTTSSIEVTGEEKISASIENRTLNEMLRMMSEKKLFEMKGPVPGGDTITLSFSNLSLDEALKKIMRGYNYVLIKQGESRKPLLMIMGKTERSNYTEQPVSVARPVDRPANQPANQPPETRSYVPPSQLPPATQPPAPTQRPGAPAQPPQTPPAMAQGQATPENAPPSINKQRQDSERAVPKDGQSAQDIPGSQAQQSEQAAALRSTGVSTRDVFAPLNPR